MPDTNYKPKRCTNQIVCACKYKRPSLLSAGIVFVNENGSELGNVGQNVPIEYAERCEKCYYAKWRFISVEDYPRYSELLIRRRVELEERKRKEVMLRYEVAKRQTEAVRRRAFEALKSKPEQLKRLQQTRRKYHGKQAGVY